MIIALNALTTALQAFTNFTGEADVQVQTVQTFLAVALGGNPSRDELARQIGLTEAAASRNLKKMCEAPRGQAGYGLIAMQLDPMDHRRRTTRLTVRGHELMRDIEEALLPPLRAHFMRELMRG
jgi:DNA-binding MarR family transcriptional regulator